MFHLYNFTLSLPPLLRLFCDTMDCSLPVSSVLGIFQARILEQVAISYSWESFQPRDRAHMSCTGEGPLYHCATWEAPATTTSHIYYWHFLTICDDRIPKFPSVFILSFILAIKTPNFSYTYDLSAWILFWLSLCPEALFFP